MYLSYLADQQMMQNGDQLSIDLITRTVFVNHTYVHRLDISLQNGKADNVNVPLHISIRFSDNVIVRNSRINKIWDREERDENLHPRATRNPIKAGVLR